jgi:hypothetical protein
MTDDEINAGLFGHKAETAPQVTAPAAVTTVRASRATAPIAPAIQTPEAAMPDVSALAKQAATGQATLVENVEPPKSKSAVESLHEAYPWLFPALAGLGTLAAAKTASGFFTGNKEEKAAPVSIADRTIRKEPTLDNERFGGLTPPKAVQLQESAPQFAGPATTPAENAAIKDPAEVMQTPEQKRKAKLAQATASIDGRIPQAPVERPAMQGTAAPSPISIEQEIGVNPQPKSYPEGMTATTPVGNEPKDMNLVRRSEYNKSENEINKAKADAAKLAKQGAVSPEGSALTKQQEGMKKHLVSLYGGGTEGEKAYQKVGEILGYTPEFPKGQGGGLAPEETKVIKAWRKEHIEGPKVNLTHDMKKVMKGAGGIAALAAIPGFAEAAQRKDYGAMTDIASDFAVLPFAQSREAGMPKAQEESIIASKFKEAQKLGSPYRSVPPPKR